MLNFGKFQKISRFMGSPQFKGPPVFLNSMPKAGTNLMENFLVILGYKRNLSRCLNESNIAKALLHPRIGRFYIGHLTDDSVIHSLGFRTIYLKRDLWSCLQSYVNYMYIDQSHPVSRFLRDAPSLETAKLLLLTNANPNKRPLVDEYLRFYKINLNNYDLCVEFNALINNDSRLINKLSQLFSLGESDVLQCLVKAKESESHTKNEGRINFFDPFQKSDIDALKEGINEHINNATSNI